MKGALKFLGNIKIALIAYTIITIAVSLIQYYNTHKQLNSGEYTSYNNYIIFKQAYHHLTEGKDLYTAYPDEYWDLFKYSPLFALSMGALAYLPDLFSLIVWNLTNVMLLFFAIRSIPILDLKTKSFLLWMILPELLINLQNTQSNALTAAFMVFTFSSLEKNKPALAALFCVLAFSIKIYGAAAALLFIFYPRKTNFILYGLAFFAISLISPLMVVNSEQLIALYQSWGNILRYDIDTSVGISVMGWINSWFNLHPDKNIIISIGILTLTLPLIKFKQFSEIKVRLNYLACIMIWVVIFNHRSESPTFIIAFTGSAIWFLNSAKKTHHIVLIIFTFILSSLSPTDIFPAALRNNYIIPYALKVFPFILIYIIMISEFNVGRAKLEE